MIAQVRSVGVVEAHVAPIRELCRTVRRAPSRQRHLRALWGPGDVPSPAHRSFQVLTVTAAAVAVFAALRAHSVSASDVALFVLPALVVADLASGFLHWFMDELAPRLGTLGEQLSAEFRDHHVRPDVCREASAWASAFAGSFVVLPLAVGAALSHHGNRAPTFIGLVLAVLLVTPEIHKWSHGARGARLVAPLQLAALLISPEAHAAHHRTDGSAYCVVTG